MKRPVLCPERIRNLKSIQRATAKTCRGDHLRALEQMTAAADAIATALGIRPSTVRAYVADQTTNLLLRMS